MVLYSLTASDAEATLGDLYQPGAHPGLSFLANLLKQPACRAWYTKDGDQITAAIWYLASGTHAELIDLVVAPSARRLGIGRAILEQSSITITLESSPFKILSLLMFGGDLKAAITISLPVHLRSITFK